jgi:hypothetical protein
VLQGMQARSDEFPDLQLDDSGDSLLGQRDFQLLVSHPTEEHRDLSDFLEHLKGSNPHEYTCKLLSAHQAKGRSRLFLPDVPEQHYSDLLRHGIPHKGFEQSAGSGILALLQVPHHRQHQVEEDEDEITLQELGWLQEHRNEYAGRWVALRGGELLATGGSAREVYAQIAGRDDVPLVVQVERRPENPFAGW